MADDSEHLPEHFDFHPCDPPRGMYFYNTDDLTDYQKEKLNEYKLKVIRDNYKYLKNHPEIKALIQFLLKGILKARPKIKLTQFLSQYLVENLEDIHETIDASRLNTEHSLGTKKSSSESSFSGNRFKRGHTSESFSSELFAQSVCEEVIQHISERVVNSNHTIKFQSTKLSDVSDRIEVLYSEV